MDVSELTAVSLFAGVGGFDLAMQRNGIKTVATVEIDKHARGVLERRFPNAKHFTDVTKVTGDELRAADFIPERGIITGGFPCQDLSVAGKRAGLAGERSGLYWEIIRLVDELSPAYLVLENVPGLLSSNGGRDMGAVIGALSTRGYGVSWRVLDAQYFGVAQRRRRVFIVGCAGDTRGTSAEILALGEGLSGDTPKGRGKKKDFTSDAQTSTLIFDRGSFGNGITINEEITPTLQARMGTGGNNTPMVAYPFHGAMVGRQEKNGPGGSGFGNANGPEYTLTSSSQALHGVVTESAVRRLTPTECERLQGFPDGWTDGQSDNHRYKQMGNAVAVPVVEWIMKRLVENV